MHKLLLKPEAKEDLEKIYKHTFYNWGLEQAEKYQDDLYNSFQLISSKEKTGKSYSFGDKPYHKLHVRKHLVFYHIENDSCIIVRILHESIDLLKHL